MVSLSQVKVSPGSKLAKSSILFTSFLASDFIFSLSKEANNAGSSSSVTPLKAFAADFKYSKKFIPLMIVEIL